MTMTTGALSKGNRALRALNRHGPVGFVKLCTLNIRLLFRGEAGRHSYIHDEAWDREHGVQTAGSVEIDEVTTPASQKVGAVRYEPTPPDCFIYLLEQAELNGDRTRTFIDLGSGKGRVLLMAAFDGFRRIIGVEFAQELHETACRNLARMRSRTAGSEISSICADAASYAFPPDPTVCFLNNPFDADLLERVISNLEASLRAQPRPLTIIYYHSNHADLLDPRSGWRVVSKGIWRDHSHHFSIHSWSPERGGARRRQQADGPKV